MQLFGIPLGRRDDQPAATPEDPSSDLPGGDNWPGIMPPPRVTNKGLLGIVNVYRAIQLLQIAVQQLTLDAWRGRQPLRGPDVPAIIRQPQLDIDASEFNAIAVASMAITGKAFWRVHRNPRGEASSVEYLDPQRCRVLESGDLAWEGSKTPLRGGISGEYVQVKLMPLPGRYDLEGLGPIQACRQTLEGILATASYGNQALTSPLAGDIPSGILSTDENLTREKADEYAERWDARRKKKIAILGHGLKYQPVLLSPADAQFIQTRQFDAVEVATLFGIPPHLLNVSVDGESRTYQNIAQADLSFIRWTAMGYLRPLEQAYTKLLPRGQTARFNLDAVLRPDTKNRYESYKLALEMGLMTIEQVQEIEGI